MFSWSALMQYVTKSKYLSFICSCQGWNSASHHFFQSLPRHVGGPWVFTGADDDEGKRISNMRMVKFETRSMSLTSAKVKTRKYWACLKSASASQQWTTSSSRLARWSTHRSHCQDLATRKNYHKLPFSRTKMGWQEWERGEETLGHLWTPRLRPG